MADAPAPTPDNEQQPQPLVMEADMEANTDVATSLEPTPATPADSEVEAQPAVEPSEPVDDPQPSSTDLTSQPDPTPQADELPDVVCQDEAPASASAPQAQVTFDTPTIASTLEVAPSPQAHANPAQEGGEWDLLVEKLRRWISSGRLQEQWQAARTPLGLLAGLIALLLTLQVYSAVLGVLESIPLLSGLLELAGLVAVVQFSLTRLLRSEDRREVIGGLKQRWQNFFGRN